MSIYYSGALRRSGGVVSAIAKQLKSVNLKAVKRITFTFDPFAENVKATREFLFLLTSPKVALTNPKCVVKTEVVCNLQPSEVKFSLIDSVKEQEEKHKEIRLLSDNLTTLELLQLCNKHISALAPQEDLTGKVLTKSEKQKISSGGGKRITKK